MAVEENTETFAAEYSATPGKVLEVVKVCVLCKLVGVKLHAAPAPDAPGTTPVESHCDVWYVGLYQAGELLA